MTPRPPAPPSSPRRAIEDEPTAAEERVGERFDLLEKAGQGGMGEVWRARDLRTGEIVAVKRLLREGGDTARFSREAKLLERVRHPALVGHIAHGEDRGRPYLAMAWLEGESLAVRLSRAPLSLAESLVVARRLADALGALHAEGIVHRDVKPLNVVLAGCDAERAVLLDLGIARPADATVALTGTNLIVGTVGYMSPEQARSGDLVDARADVFALGCLLFECVAGEPLYRGDNAIAILANLLVQEPRRLRTARPEVPEALDDLVASLLARDLERRPRDGRAVVRLLDQLGAMEGSVALRAPAAPAALSRVEQRFALASVVEVASLGDDDATVDAGAAGESMTRIDDAVRAAGGQLIPLTGASGLIVAEARGTVADRVQLAASVLRAAIQAVPQARAGLAAGLTTTHAGAPAGEVLARAASLSRGAAAGTIAVDSTAGELLGDRFELVDSVLGSARESPGERATPFVGRERELGMLEATLAEVLDEGAPRGVLVTAPPGTGKSRLGRELIKRLASRGDVRVLSARADVTTAGSLNAIAKALVRAAASLPRQASPADAAAIRGHLATLPTLESPARVGDFLCELLGVPTLAPGFELGASRGDAELTSKWMRRTMREWLAAECAASPTVLLLEDLHWADELSLAYLAEALRMLDSSPLLVVALARPEVREQLRGPWARTSEIALSELGTKSSERLVRAALGAGASIALVAQVVERGAGNPLFLEELARFAKANRDEGLPASIAAVLHARFDELLPEQRRVLRVASVLGDRFEAAQVAAMAGETGPEVERTLATLAGKSLVERADEQWAFHHALVRETAYATLSPDDARLAHTRAADWLEARGAPDPLEMLRHVERTGDEAREARWIVEAAGRAAEAGADEVAWGLAERGLKLPQPPRHEGKLHAWAAAASVFRKGAPRVGLDHANRALELLPPDDEVASSALGCAAYCALACGDGDTIARVLQRWRTAPTAPRGRMAALGLAAIVSALARFGMTEAADAVLAQASSLADDPAGAAWYFVALAVRSVGRGAIGAARALSVDAGDMATRAGDDLARDAARICEFVFGLFCRSSRLLAEMERAAPDVGENLFTDYFRLRLAAVRVQTGVGDLDELETFARAPDVSFAEGARVALASVLWDEPPDRAEEALARRPFLTPDQRATAHAVRAWLAMRRGDAPLALALAAEAEALAERVVSAWAWEILHLARTAALHALGRTDEARLSMKAAIARLQISLEGSDDFLLAVVDEGCLPVLELRKLAAELGVVFPSLVDLRGRGAAVEGLATSESG